MDSNEPATTDEGRHTGPFGREIDVVRARRVRISNLSFAYQSARVFEDFGLDAQGRIFVLRGPSGCGKTTLLKLCAGVLERGEGIIEPLFERPVLILQEDALFPWLTGEQNILRIAKVTPEDLRNSPLYSRIEGFVKQRACQMSFGQRRIIEITRALLVKPDLLCLDEPLNFIDASSRSLILDRKSVV